jgi:hypothetical protein
MSMSGLFWRFALAYLVLLLGLGLGLNLLGVQSGSGINTAALLAAVMWVCMSFGKKNGRYFTREEKRGAVLGMLGIDVAIQLLVTVVAAAAEWFGPTRGRPVVGAIAVVVIFVAVLHAAVIYFFVGMAGRQVAAAAGKAPGSSK